MSTTATPAPVRPIFRRGDVVRYDARANGEAVGRIRRVVNVRGATKTIRYYAIDGAGLLVPDADVLAKAA